MAGEINDDTHRKELETIRDVLARLQAMAVANQGPASVQGVESDQSNRNSAGAQLKDSQGLGSIPIHRQPDGFLSSFASFREADAAAKKAHARQGNSSPDDIGHVHGHGDLNSKMIGGEPGPETGPELGPGRVGELRFQSEHVRHIRGGDKKSSSVAVKVGKRSGGWLAITVLGLIAAVGGGVFVFMASQSPTASTPLAAESIQVPSATALTAQGGNPERDAGLPVAPAPAPTARAETVTEPPAQRSSIEFDHAIEISGGGAISLPIHIDAAVLEGISDYYVTLSGLPVGAMLSKGRMVFPGTWAIEQTEMQDLRLVMPLNRPATISVGLMLVGRPGRVIAEGSGIITVRASGSVGPSDPAARGAEIVDVSHGRVARGLALLAIDKIGAARALFKVAAESGDADGAYFFALTYDPQFSRNGTGDDAKPDVDVAKQWYTVAASRGSGDAAERLRQLSAN